MYMLLDEEDQARIRQRRLLGLEREHYALVLQLAEMDVVGVSAEDEGRQTVQGDIAALVAAIAWHQHELFPPPRVEPQADGSTGDDESDLTEPVGEEAPA